MQAVAHVLFAKGEKRSNGSGETVNMTFDGYKWQGNRENRDLNETGKGVFART